MSNSLKLVNFKKLRLNDEDEVIEFDKEERVELLIKT